MGIAGYPNSLYEVVNDVEINDIVFDNYEDIENPYDTGNYEDIENPYDTGNYEDIENPYDTGNNVENINYEEINTNDDSTFGQEGYQS